MTYQETIDYLYSRLPVFHNIGARAFKPGLRTTQQLCEVLGDPQNSFRAIHVGGTNGKGSTSHMLAAILQHAGFKVGLYTSPHLKSFTERVRINGKAIEEKYVVDFVSDNLFNIDRFEPSFFELTVALAFSYFRDRDVDIAVIEVGMGGRLDSTNIITPILSLITNVSLDHVQFLGDTLEKIAREKAGIIKPGIPVVVSERQSVSVCDVFETKASETGSKIRYGADSYKVSLGSHVEEGASSVKVVSVGGKGFSGKLTLDLRGSYQQKNVAGVLTAVDELRKIGYDIREKAITEGIASVSSTTGLKGRWQRLGVSPLIICDTAHNVAGLTMTLEQFEVIPATRRRFVIGFVGDKDVSGILALFPKDADYYFCQPGNARALPAVDLASLASGFGLNGKVYGDVNEALKSCISESVSTDCIYVGGSTFVVADLEIL